jgi:hypothetical protein
LLGVILSATFVSWPLPLAPSVARLIVSSGLFRLKSTRLFFRVVLGKNATDELKRLFPAILARLTPEVLAARARAVMALDCSEELRACPVPVLALVADRDRIVSRRCPEMMKSIRPDLEIVHFDSPHLILQLASAKAAGQICRFAEEVREAINYPGRNDDSSQQSDL